MYSVNVISIFNMEVTMNNSSEKTIKANLWGKQQLWIMFFAGVMFLLCGSVAAGNTNTVLPYFAAAKGWNLAFMIIMVSVGGYVSVAANFIFGQLLMKTGTKIIIIIGLIGGGISALIFGTTDNYIIFNIMIVLNFFFGGAYQAAAAGTLLASWFPRKKGIVLGWSTMGMVLASVLWAPYITKIFDTIGIKATFIIVAVIFWIFALLCAFTVKNTPEEAGTWPDGDPNGIDAMKTANGAFTNYKSPFTIPRLLKTKQTWQLMFGWGLPWFGMMAIFSQFVPRLISVGYSPAFAAFVLSISGIIALPGSWFFGFLDTKIGCKKASVILAFILLIGAVVALLHQKGILFVWISAAAMAMGQGALANLVPSMIATWFGRWDFAAANRLLFPLVNIVATLGMTVVGIFLTKDLAYSNLYILCIILIAIGLIIIFSTNEKIIGKTD